MEDIQRKVDSVPFWFHTMDFGGGIASPGFKSANLLEEEARPPRIPENLEDKTVLDIGAWDGFFSFEAEKRGAKHVVALDHYVWSLDLPAQHGYWQNCKDTGKTAEPYHTIPELWHPDNLPGKAGFDLAKELLGSKVESRVGDFMTLDSTVLGNFDIVLFLGVLYHMENPLDALKRVAAATKELAVIETAIFRTENLEHLPLSRFFELDELNHDISNWWTPNLACLTAMCRAVGFEEVRVVEAECPAPSESKYETSGRAIIHASFSNKH